MEEPRLVTAAERPDLVDEMRRVGSLPWPEFLGHDEAVSAHWDALFERFPDYQFALLDREGEPIAVGDCVPIAWDGDPASLPSGGLDAILDRTLSPTRDVDPPDAASALMIVVEPGHLGQGLSRTCVERMRELVSAHGLSHLVAPVRPVAKHLYPLIDMQDYARWRRPDGTLFDPWLRTHARLGAISAGVAPSSMRVRGSVSDWERWTGLRMPQSGSYIVSGALVPVEVDVDRDVGSYVEPNCWMVHRTP